jgi:hypothetical protein
VRVREIWVRCRRLSLGRRRMNRPLALRLEGDEEQTASE